MSPSRTSIAATFFGVVVATLGAAAIQAHEVRQAAEPVVVQLERVEIVGHREAQVALAPAERQH
ncbi:hypothetical protein [Rivibacter subsaxonicus]|uniref:Uncharacterized protein n=1 Tax=Rivibacter subsaxonicus TaxID=457575 RepID=A0A4Q7W1G3_9BURK|nr:hypothetical protein [Rivibacter subsaxonicus]RZU03114.1 hypothetical protein EV670_1147 [Rivibacter subsaxonicus]